MQIQEPSGEIIAEPAEAPELAPATEPAAPTTRSAMFRRLSGAERRRMEWRRITVLQHELRLQRRDPDPPVQQRVVRGRQGVALKRATDS